MLIRKLLVLSDCKIDEKVWRPVTHSFSVLELSETKKSPHDFFGYKSFWHLFIPPFMVQQKIHTRKMGNYRNFQKQDKLRENTTVKYPTFRKFYPGHRKKICFGLLKFFCWKTNSKTVYCFPFWASNIEKAKQEHVFWNIWYVRFIVFPVIPGLKILSTKFTRKS